MANVQTVADIDDVKDGEIKAFDVDGRRIAVANAGGEFFAFDDTCTHKGCPLSDGELDSGAVVCPCHGSMFDVRTGEVKSPPAAEPIGVYPVQVDGRSIKLEIP